MMEGGGSIERVLIVESNKSSFFVVDEVMKVLKQYPEFELLLLKHKPVLLLSGLEIDPAHRKVYGSFLCEGNIKEMSLKDIIDRYKYLSLFPS